MICGNLVVQGVRGAQGAQGTRGERGADGNTGAPGPRGATGSTGAKVGMREKENDCENSHSFMIYVANNRVGTSWSSWSKGRSWSRWS